MNNLFFDSNLVSIEKRSFELVERKGIGHPDTLADGVAEAICLEYSNYCYNHFGAILHQMLDKIMFIGGKGEFAFNYGKMLEPWKLIINGKLTESFGNTQINYQDLATRVTKDYLRKVIPNLDVERWLNIIFYTSTSSKAPYWFHPRTLTDVPDASNPYANDTVTAVGYWPLSITERLTLLMERYFYHKNDTPRFSFIGQDIKILSVRKKKNIDITICVPFFSAKTPNADVYFSRKRKIQNDLQNIANQFLKGKYKVILSINTQDEMINNPSRGIGFYFVVSGSALDSGEEGVVGRGNRSRGLISNVRPYSIEGIHGKNPVYHVGKVFNYIADLFAKKISEEFRCECNVFISSRNGDDLNIPRHIIIQTDKKIINKKKVNVVLDKILEKNIAKEILLHKPYLPIPGGGNGYVASLSI
ncbi:MAG: methionine adenosyltransferase [Candidatus Pacebacteria bacterium]|nr:methionine adenosyltransferase [Candidatus Paceibacterota bacterium]